MKIPKPEYPMGYGITCEVATNNANSISNLAIIGGRQNG
jgi:hypothetical protein